MFLSLFISLFIYFLFFFWRDFYVKILIFKISWTFSDKTVKYACTIYKQSSYKSGTNIFFMVIVHVYNEYKHNLSMTEIQLVRKNTTTFLSLVPMLRD